MAKGGTKHQQAQIIIRDYYRRLGKIAIIEGFIGGKHVDVLICNLLTKKTEAVEFETRYTPQALKNIFLDTERCHACTVVSSKPDVIKKIKSKAKKTFSPEKCRKLKFRLLDDFIPHGRNKLPINIAK